MINTGQMNRVVDDLARELHAARGEQERLRSLEIVVREREEEARDWKVRFQNSEKTLASVAGRGEEDLKTIQVCFFFSLSFLPLALVLLLPF